MCVDLGAGDQTEYEEEAVGARNLCREICKLFDVDIDRVTPKCT